ncbi:methane monooxygenase [Mycolicibacterium stellerae]|uniref:methane monooxygenase n=1 Tax=Mycolicibacterium stellerae TaxID=2358193 RepID=UPI000F0B6465|nr:methane monooxygenase [Mycolicibacterium stellerae]
MTRRARAKANAGATPRTSYPPYGDQSLRGEWTARLTQVATLQDSVGLLTAWRNGRGGNPLEETDFLWIEARIEDRVAVLRFAELSSESIETMTLTGESIEEVCAAALADATAANSVEDLEAVVMAFRRRFKPPMMPTVPFMRTETQLAEILIKLRCKGWFDEPLDDLRRRRNASVITTDIAIS